MRNILNLLLPLQDTAFEVWRVLPDIERETIIGVRTPQLRKLAKQLVRESQIEQFLNNLPHRYFEENQLHAFIISETKDFEHCIRQVEQFLPYIDNWATCDQLSPRCFKKHTQELLPHIERWMASNEPYTIRFGIGMLMRYFLDDEFKSEYLQRVAAIRSEHYYVRMMQAWFFATALAKQWDATLPYMTKQHSPVFDDWTRRKAIQKARESYRITAEQKQYLQTL